MLSSTYIFKTDLKWPSMKMTIYSRVCILGLFCSKQGQGFKPSAAHLYPNFGRAPPLSSPPRASIHNLHTHLKVSGPKCTQSSFSSS